MPRRLGGSRTTCTYPEPEQIMTNGQGLAVISLLCLLCLFTFFCYIALVLILAELRSRS